MKPPESKSETEKQSREQITPIDTMGGLILKVEAYFTKHGMGQESGLSRQTPGHMSLMNSGLENQLTDLTRELSPISFNGTVHCSGFAVVPSVMRLGNSKSVEEVVNILKKYGFFGVPKD